MWELYGLWTWFLSIYTDFLERTEAGTGDESGEADRKRLASLIAFAVAGPSSVACIFVGWIGKRAGFGPEGRGRPCQWHSSACLAG